MQRFKALPMTLAMLSLLVVFSLATSALARPRGYGHDRLTRLEEQMDSLGVDDTNRADIQSAIDKARAAQSDIRNQLRQAYKDLGASMQQDSPDAEAVSLQLDKIGNLQAAYQKTTTMAWLEAVGKLTPAQRASLRDSRRGHGAWKGGQGQ